MKDDAGVENRERLLHRIRGEYMEMPGLRLTRAQAQRLWGLDEQTCESVLEFLVEAGFLRRTGDGTFARLSEGGGSLPPLRMAKAQADLKLKPAPPKAGREPPAA